MFLKFEINLGVIGSLTTENGLHVAGFYTYLVELKYPLYPCQQRYSRLFYTYLVELKYNLGELAGFLLELVLYLLSGIEMRDLSLDRVCPHKLVLYLLSGIEITLFQK